MRFAQGKLREGAVAMGSEILRCAQDDRAGPCLNKEGQPCQNRWTKPAYSTSCVQNMLHWRQYWLRWTRRGYPHQESLGIGRPNIFSPHFPPGTLASSTA